MTALCLVESAITLRANVKNGIIKNWTMIRSFFEEEMIQNSYAQIIEASIKSSENREKLYKNAPVCPKCETNQVQLIDSNSPAEWRCRHCKTRFTFG